MLKYIASGVCRDGVGWFQVDVNDTVNVTGLSALFQPGLADIWLRSGVIGTQVGSGWAKVTFV